ncbi:hypothetical protein D1007_37212 [Hordeum vulgare]|nr:hypothetical protein D1007_37212 [Hordeum vulgare]
MAESFPDDGVTTNGFGRRWVHEWEARMLKEANYPPMPDMPPSPSDGNAPPTLFAFGRPCRSTRVSSQVLEHNERGDEPPLEYPAPRRMASSSSDSRSPSVATSLVAVKPKPHETSLCRCTRDGNLVINEGSCDPSPPRGHLRLVKPKKEPPTPVVKKEHVKMAADLSLLRGDYVREEMKRQHRALKEIAERHRCRDEGGAIVLYDSDDEATAPKPVRSDDLGQGCCKHGGVKDEPPSDDNDDDYTVFYNLLGMK